MCSHRLNPSDTAISSYRVCRLERQIANNAEEYTRTLRRVRTRTALLKQIEERSLNMESKCFGESIIFKVFTMKPCRLQRAQAGRQQEGTHHFDVRVIILSYCLLL